jgi:hypothetical protein
MAGTYNGVQGISSGCASIPLKFKADCMVMVAAVMYRGSLMALFSVRIATFQQCVSRSSGDNALISLMVSPTVFSVVPLQTNSNDSGLVPINEIKSPSQRQEIWSRGIYFPAGVGGVGFGHEVTLTS